MARLLKYQLDHLKERLDGVVRRKQRDIREEGARESKKIPKPQLIDETEALHMLWELDFPVSAKKVKKFKISTTGWYDGQHECRTGIDVLSLSGARKENERRKKEYDKAIEKNERPYQKRIAKVEIERDKVFDALVLAGAEGFEEALAEFEKRDF